MLTITRIPADGPPVVDPGFDFARLKDLDGEVVWVDLEAPTEEELALLTDPFQFHPLAIEDLLTPEHQPKIEDFGPYLFMIFRGIDARAGNETFHTMKLAAFLGPEWIVTYHKAPMRSLTTVREKYALPQSAGICRGSPWILYEILDLMIDHYFPILEGIELRMDEIEAALFKDTGTATLDGILDAKRRVLEIRRALLPHRELFGRISRNEFEEIDPAMTVFYRDLYDSTYRLTEETDAFRDLLSSTLDAYLSVVSQRLNEVMKTLTIIATIMLPITFIAGIYGMNFDHMPELHWKYGYAFALAIMAAVAGGFVWFFRRRGWL